MLKVQLHSAGFVMLRQQLLANRTARRLLHGRLDDLRSRHARLQRELQSTGAWGKEQEGSVADLSAKVRGICQLLLGRQGTRHQSGKACCTVAIGRLAEYDGRGLACGAGGQRGQADCVAKLTAC